MIEGINFHYNKIFTENNYLINYCEITFNEKNYLQKQIFKNFPERMVYESEIWIIGETIRKGIIDEKKNKTNNYLKITDQIIEIINKKKYKKGRESFVMLLPYYENNIKIINLLEKILEDNELYGFSIYALNKLKEYKFKNKIIEIGKEEKNGWIKKEIRKYIKNAE
jgi:hypothetical protein